MKRKKQSRSRRRRLYQAVKGGPLRFRKKKEPAIPISPDGATAHNTHTAGILRLEDDNWRLPEALAEAGETEENGMRPSSVVIVITSLAIIFITIIAWFVSQMPEK
ncbi:MAG: hypothetical protein AB7U82_26635 [Blastocatellales bacterium]